MLADVDAGTDTPAAVGKVLSWKKQHAEQGQLDFVPKSISH